MKNLLLTLFNCMLLLSLSAQDLEIDTLLNNGNKDNRINFAFANVDHASANSYTDRLDFIGDLQDIVDRFNPNSPLMKNGYAQYSNFFNLYSVWFNDPFIFEAIPTYYQQSQAVIDDLFLPWADDKHGWVTMMYSLKGGGGGGAGRRDDLRRGDALIWGLEWETILHEFNHTMTGVGDEYTASGEWSNFVCNEGANQTPALSIDDVPWRNWIEPGTPIPTPYAEEYFGKIGAFEGTISGYFGCQRPTAQSCYMGAGGFGDGFGQDMCAVCLQRFICRTYQFVDAIENEFPTQQSINVTNNETVTFSVETVKPIPNTQQYKWILNGRCIAENVETIDIKFGKCDKYELIFELLDTTDFVRYDEKYDYLYPEPRQTHTWNIKNQEAEVSNLSATLIVLSAGCSGNNGQISVAVSGSINLPFSYFIDGSEFDGSIENLSVGVYEILIQDATGCSITKTAEITQIQSLEYEIVSEHMDGVWKLYPIFEDENPSANYAYTWSNGSSEREAFVTDLGTYSLEVKINEDCNNTKQIELSATPCEGLGVTHDAKNATDNWLGAIHLDIANGSAPYTIQWQRSVAQDQTTNDPSASFSSGNDQNPIHITAFLFDDIVEYNIDFWAEGFTGMNYAGYNFGQRTIVDYYSLTSNIDVQGRDAKNWTFEGSNDMVTWDVLDTKENITFENRLEKKEFFLNESFEYQYYRVFITENHGDGWIAIQEMEFGSRENSEEIKASQNQPYLIDIPAGKYHYKVTDANGNQVSEEVILSNEGTGVQSNIIVVQDGPNTVKVETPGLGLMYQWFADNKAQTLLHQGDDFQPLYPGNYYVRAVDMFNFNYASSIKGFAVTMQAAPEVEIDNGVFTIKDPNPDAEYFWYDALTGGLELHTGTSFTPTEMGDYYVSMRLVQNTKTPINPETIDGITLWADASDIDGDGILDEGLDNSSAYKWKFRENGNWEENGWHAYRSNYSNGLGVVEMATVWFQYVNNTDVDMRTFIIAYEENGFSRVTSAPFYGLKSFMGRNASQDQLFHNDISDATKNGIVHVNGEVVDPTTTFNSYKMKSLSVVLDQTRNLDLYACDEYWEGKIGEFIAFDRALNETELEGLHEYLRKKWLSTADLDSPRTLASSNENITYQITEDISLCYGENYLGLTEAGTYIRVMKTSEGYDSIVTTNLVLSQLNPNSPPLLIKNGNVLSSSFDGASYQWYLNGVLIDGATDKDYTAAESGVYFLVITDIYGCSLNTDGLPVVISSAQDLNLSLVKVYPNPTIDFVTLEIEHGALINYSIANATGMIIMKGQLKAKTTVIDMSTFDRGVYLLTLESFGKIRSVRLIKI